MTNMAGYTALKDLQDVLVTMTLQDVPQIKLIYDEKTIGIVEDNKESIFLKLDNENPLYFLHGDDTFHTVMVTLDIWTYNSLDRLSDIVSAVFSILKKNVRFYINGHSYSDLLVTGNHPLSDQYRNIFRHTMDIQLRITNPT